jgi:C4-type Zn-finger protein
MKKVRGASPELEIKFSALVISEEEIENWIEGLLNELSEKLSSDSTSPILHDTETLKQRVLAEANRIVNDKLLNAIKEKGSTAVVIVKDKLSNGYLCDIVTGSYFYLSVLDVLNKIISESLSGIEVEETEPNA